MKVLIVDDDKFERDGLRYLLNNISKELEELNIDSFDIKDVRNGKLALELFRKEKFDIVITDIKMPVMDGMTFLEKAKDLGLKAVFIIYSGYDDFSYAKRALSLNVLDFLVKPIDEAEFERVMINAIIKVKKTHSEEMEILLDEAMNEDSEDGDKIIYKVKKFISKNYGNDISVDDISDYVFLNSAYLCTIFKKSTGDTLIHYLTKYRMEKAKKFLEEKDLKISEVAKMVGYKNTSYFNMLFKKHTNKTPKQYRKEINH